MFQKLLRLIPGLEDRLASPEVTEQDVMDMADLVSHDTLLILSPDSFPVLKRFSRALLVLEQITPRA